MGKFGGIELSETKLCGYVTYGGVITVGYTEIDEIDYSYGLINSNIIEAADIDNPTSWTDLVDISGDQILVLISNNLGLYIEVAPGEDVDDALRIQILKKIGSWDVIWDGKAVRDASGSSVCKCRSVTNNSIYIPCPISIQPIFCSSFKIRAVRHGTFADVSSHLKIPSIYYSDVERV